MTSQSSEGDRSHDHATGDGTWETAECSVKGCGEAFEYWMPGWFKRMFPTSSLHPTICGKCAEKREDKELIEAGKRAKALEPPTLEELWTATCPAFYIGMKPALLPEPKRLEEALAWQYGPRSLLLVGPTGRGKTFIAYHLLKRCMTEGKTVIAFQPNEFGHEVAKQFGACKGDEFIARVLEHDVVMFDDFGKEALTDRVESELFGVVERMTAQLKPMIITSQFTGPRLAARFSRTDLGAALVRRLREYCDVILFGRGMVPPVGEGGGR